MIIRKYRFLDFNKILGTCRKNPTKDEYEMCIQYCLQYLSNGHVPDEAFEELGFPMDEDTDESFGRRRTTTINQE